MSLIGYYKELSEQVSKLSFSSPVEYVYNPLTYAWRSHQAYLERFGQTPKRVIFLGMNPGPFGMVQTGVPFGDVRTVGEWLLIDEELGPFPHSVHPKREIMGLRCTRVEVSGARLWGWIRSRWETPEAFFSESFVANYCPLVFLEQSGRNRTPDKLKAPERKALYALCNASLNEVVRHLGVQWVVAIGAFAESRAREALAEIPDLRLGRILHPSPASPIANRGWAEAAENQLESLGVYPLMTTRESGKPE